MLEAEGGGSYCYLQNPAYKQFNQQHPIQVSHLIERLRNQIVVCHCVRTYGGSQPVLQSCCCICTTERINLMSCGRGRWLRERIVTSSGARRDCRRVDDASSAPSPTPNARSISEPIGASLGTGAPVGSWALLPVVTHGLCACSKKLRYTRQLRSSLSGD